MLEILQAKTDAFREKDELAYKACFSQADAAVAVYANSPQVFAHLRSYLYSYDVTAVAEPRWSVEIRYGFPFEEVEPAFEGIPAVDIEHGRTLATIADGTCYWYSIPERQSLVKQDPASQRVEIYSASYSQGKAIAHDVIRQIITGQLMGEGYLLLHAAAVVARNKGILIAGFKGQGKTSTALVFLKRFSADYISNDQILIGQEGQELVARACPMSVKLGIGTLLQYPDLADLIPDHIAVALREASADSFGFYAHQKIKIDKSRLLSSGEIRTSCRPSVILLPSIDLTLAETHLEVVSPDTVRATFVEEKMFMDKHSTVWLKLNEWQLPVPSQFDLIEEIANSTTCYRIMTNGNVDELARELDRALFASVD
jgi:hypothetical protein